MTPLEEYEKEIKRLKNFYAKLLKTGEKQLKEKLEESQKTCKHKFSSLMKIGWFPDVDIMGYVCSNCGFEKRQ